MTVESTNQGSPTCQQNPLAVFFPATVVWLSHLNVAIARMQEVSGVREAHRGMNNVRSRYSSAVEAS